MLAQFIKWVIAIILALIGIDYSPDREKESSSLSSIHLVVADVGGRSFHNAANCQFGSTQLATPKPGICDA